MAVIFDGKKIEPAPFIEIRKEISRTGSGDVSTMTYVISVKGKLSADRGSPNSSGEFYTGSGYAPIENIPAESRLRSILKKQGAMINLFCNDYKLFEVQPWDNTAPFKAIVIPRGVSFAEGTWFDTCDYTIELEATKLWFGSTEVCSGGTALTTPPEENWTIEQVDEKFDTYRLQHTVAAQAKHEYNDSGTRVKKGWEVARDIIKTATGVTQDAPYLGLVNSFYDSDSALPLPAHQAYNYLRSIQVDEAQGRYSVTETWLLYDPARTNSIPCLEDYNINTRKGEDGRIRVSVEGTLTGLQVRDNNTYGPITTTKIANAEARWTQLKANLYNVANANSEGSTLNVEPLSATVGRNNMSGTITFSREYDDRPVVFPGAISAVIQVTETRPNDVFASLVVLGKPDGPVLQSIGTVTASRRTLSIEIVMPAATVANASPTKPNTDSIVASFVPSGSFKERDEDNWSAQTGRYSRQVSWTWV